MKIEISSLDKTEMVVVRVGAAARMEQIAKSLLRRIQSINQSMRSAS